MYYFQMGIRGGLLDYDECQWTRGDPSTVGEIEHWSVAGIGWKGEASLFWA